MSGDRNVSCHVSAAGATAEHANSKGKMKYADFTGDDRKRLTSYSPAGDGVVLADLGGIGNWRVA